MRIIDIRWFRRLLLTSIFTLGIVGILASGSSSDDDTPTVSFPTPTLPASAVTIDVNNADVIAAQALIFTDLFFLLGELKTEAPPSVADVIRRVIDHVKQRDRSSLSVATGVTEDVTADYCVSGTATETYTETATSATGTLSFSNCDIGSGIVLDGSISYSATFNNSLDYSIQVGGNFTVIVSPDSVTVVLNLSESGNENTGIYSASISYSLSGTPDGDFLVTTPIDWDGNSNLGEVYTGQILIQGANNSQLRITVISTNTANIEYDDGQGGGWVLTVSSPITL